MRYFLADIFLPCNLSKGVHFSGQGRRNARGFKKSMRIYSWKCGKRNNGKCEKARKISLFQALQKNSLPKPDGLCCMKVCYIRQHSWGIRVFIHVPFHPYPHPCIIKCFPASGLPAIKFHFPNVSQYLPLRLLPAKLKHSA